ncbi:MAG: riboflavin synthase subunit alpha [Acidobacteria bacterium RIFCSPLOWO2_02_FULL_67_36]|nr:MAG: riboflavin synthase subunit alpha [Acidobacteria bacterium RIFCSPLOWO2_02_FULL_67_36]OFW18415.1 MAG: riboflavin synthase subunit alpha [Acidobacteria bacterium RIFCSPLOWO2_12_FULL_66_21]
MFTGLIESIGEVAEIKPTPAGFRLRVTTTLAPDMAAGESLSVNGVCLTVISADPDGIHADISPETARVSTLGALRRGALVNLERPLRADARLGGHFVQGHIDATGKIEDIRQDGDSYWLTIRFPQALAPYIVRKGSIAVNGISLTVAGVDDRDFDVQIIPFTWDHTNLRAAKPGEMVNVECDILGKYVVRVAELAGMTKPR